MNELEFTFDTALDDLWLQQLKPGQRVSAAQLLMQYEGADEEQLENVFLQLEENDIALDISDLALPASSGEAASRLQLEQQLVKQGLQGSQLEPTDPLRLYLEELAQIPAAGDICRLAQELCEANCAGNAADDLRTCIVNLSLGRVVELASEYAGKGVLLLDMIQEGNIGLWRAIELFQGNVTEFEAFRDQRIRYYLNKAVILHAHISGIGQKLRAALEDYRSVDERLLGELGRIPTVEEMAQALHMTVEETVVVAKTLENARLLNRTFRPEPEELPQEEDQAVEDTAYFQMRQRIADLLASLSESDAQLLRLRYGLEGGMPMSQQQTAARLGITADEVVAREIAALSKLRQQKE